MYIIKCLIDKRTGEKVTSREYGKRIKGTYGGSRYIEKFRKAPFNIYNKEEIREYLKKKHGKGYYLVYEIAGGRNIRYFLKGRDGWIE